jgi:uncharacterized membrane protein
MSTSTISRPTVPHTPTTMENDATHRPAVMRQTQALIGIVLLASLAAAYFLNVVWGVVPVLIGFGLLFAGVSGACPMASLIARMPWNRDPNPTGPASSNPCCGGRCG